MLLGGVASVSEILLDFGVQGGGLAFLEMLYAFNGQKWGFVGCLPICMHNGGIPRCAEGCGFHTTLPKGYPIQSN